MIKIVTKKNNGFVYEINITGHANYDDYGKDIVCASVSSIATTTINDIISLDDHAINYEQLEGKLNIKIINDNEIAIKLTSNMLRMLKELALSYPKNVEIREED